VAHPFVARLERFGSVPSTQPIVRGWLDEGTPEVAIAVADEQTAGRGRLDRTWTAPSGAALLVSAGFRPLDLPARHAWRLAATASLAMLDAAEDVAGLRDGTLGLKWPNDIVADGLDGMLRKVAGVLGEASLDGDRVLAAVVGVGVNADWPLEHFPADLAPSMTSLRELSGGRPIDRDALLDAWLVRLEPRYQALTLGRFDAGGWSSRQRTTGHTVEVDGPHGRLTARAMGVDPDTGALLVAGADGTGTAIDSGDVTRCRVVALPTALVRDQPAEPRRADRHSGR
jgi:BirA family biotin operon repressor/biotin-[acetyl-CoA-carboxylase] ligase